MIANHYPFKSYRTNFPTTSDGRNKFIPFLLPLKKQVFCPCSKIRLIHDFVHPLYFKSQAIPEILLPNIGEALSTILNLSKKTIRLISDLFFLSNSRLPIFLTFMFGRTCRHYCISRSPFRKQKIEKIDIVSLFFHRTFLFPVLFYPESLHQKSLIKKYIKSNI